MAEEKTISTLLTELQETKSDIKTAIEGKLGEGTLANIPFTEYADKITAIRGVVMDSGDYTRARSYKFIDFTYDLPKKAKLITCFHENYQNTSLDCIGFIYANGIATIYYLDSTATALSSQHITMEGKDPPSAGEIVVTDSTVSGNNKQTTRTFASGTYYWEAYTW